MTHDRLVHIHATPGDPCIACGDLDTSDNDFLLNPGDWNQEARNCSPLKIVSPDFVLRPRHEPRTSALKGERKVNQKRVRDPR